MAAILWSNPIWYFFFISKEPTSMLMPETVPLSCSLITTFNLNLQLLKYLDVDDHLIGN